MKRIIAIVAGGDSSEHDVSMRSAEGILIVVAVNSEDSASVVYEALCFGRCFPA